MDEDRIEITVGNDRYYRKSSRRSASNSKEYLSGPLSNSPRYPNSSKNSSNGDGVWQSQRDKFSQEPPSEYYNPKRREEEGRFHNERDFGRPPPSNISHDYPPPRPREEPYFRRSRSPGQNYSQTNYRDEKGNYNRFDTDMPHGRLSPSRPQNDHYSKRMISPSRSGEDYGRDIPVDQNARNREPPRPLSSVPKNWSNKDSFSYGTNRDLDYSRRPKEAPVDVIDLREWSPRRSPNRTIVQASYEDRTAIYKEADERYLRNMKRERSMAECYDQEPNKMARNNSSSIDNIGPELKKYVRGFDQDKSYDPFSSDRNVPDYFQKSFSPIRSSNDNAITPGGFNKDDVSNILKVVGIEAGSAQTYLNKIGNKNEDPYKKIRKNSEKDDSFHAVLKSFPPGYDRSFAGPDTANTSTFSAGKVDPAKCSNRDGVIAVLKNELKTQKEKCIKMISDGGMGGREEKDLEKLQTLQGLLNKCMQADMMVKQKKSSFAGGDEVGGEKLEDCYENERSQYGDGGKHLCGVCKRDFDELPAFLAHLHSNLHKALMDDTDRPWAKNSTLGPNDSALPEMWSLPLKGADTLVPVNGFYCTVCSRFCGDQVQAEVHLLSNKHNERYLTSFKDSVLNDIDNDGAGNASGGSKTEHFRAIEMKQENFLANLMRKTNPKTHVLRHYRKDDSNNSTASRKYNTSSLNEQRSKRRSRSLEQSPVRHRPRSGVSPPKNRRRPSIDPSTSGRRRSSTDRSSARASFEAVRGNSPPNYRAPRPDRRRSPQSSYRKRSLSPSSKKRRTTPPHQSNWTPRRSPARRANRRSPPRRPNRRSPKKSPIRNSKQERRSYEVEADKAKSEKNPSTAEKKPERRVSIGDGNLKSSTKPSTGADQKRSSQSNVSKKRPEKVEPLPPGTE